MPISMAPMPAMNAGRNPAMLSHIRGAPIGLPSLFVISRILDLQLSELIEPAGSINQCSKTSGKIELVSSIIGAENA